MKKFVSIAVLSALLLCGCSKAEEHAYDPVPVVETMTAQKGTLTQSSTYIGTVTSDQLGEVVSSSRFVALDPNLHEQNMMKYGLKSKWKVNIGNKLLKNEKYAYRIIAEKKYKLQRGNSIWI